MKTDGAHDIDRPDLNSASVEALSQVPGVGRALAERIIAGRPYAQTEELRRVSGLGAAKVEHLKEWVRVESPDGDSDAGRKPRASQPRPSPTPSAYSRRQVIGLLVICAALSIFLSVALTLVTLVGINGSLDVANNRAVRDLQSQTGQLAQSVQALGGRLDAVDQRVQALQGLTGRMSDVESQTGKLADDVQAAQAQVSDLGQQVDSLGAAADELDQRQSKLEAVFQALANLLSPWADQPITPSPTPTPGG